MKHTRCTVTVLAVVLSVAAQIPAHAQTPAPTAAVTVAASGSFAKGGEFEGTFTINRVEQRGNQIVAIGVLSGALSRGGQTLGSALVGQVALPVAIRVGGQVFASGPARSGTHIMSIALIAQEPCQVVNVTIGPHTIDVLGAQLALDPIALNFTGVPGTPLGDMVCEVNKLIGNVAAVVGVVNNILALLTTLLGALTGGLGGIPVP
ncbi:MAG TPA: hypothetical protein VJ691_14200 [Vicinamibacterales bacterium]|nr:hypothetical protein [Vicinamibacterales bacterium]